MYNQFWHVDFSFKFLLPWHIGPSGLLPSELICNYGSYWQLVELLGREIRPSPRSLPTHRTTPTQKKLWRKYMPGVGFELTIPLFERAKKFLATDRAAAVMGSFSSDGSNITCISYLPRECYMPFLSRSSYSNHYLYRRLGMDKTVPLQILFKLANV